MAFVRGIIAIFVGLLVTAIVGAAYDYLRPEPLLDPVNTKFLYPWITGLSGALGALIAVLVYGPGQRSQNPQAAAPRPVRERPAKVKPQKAKKAVPDAKPEPLAKPEPKPTLETSQDVPGMPTFDFDKARKDAAPPKEKQ